MLICFQSAVKHEGNFCKTTLNKNRNVSSSNENMVELMTIQQMCWLVHSLWLFSGVGSIIIIVIDPLLWSQLSVIILKSRMMFFCLLFVLSRCSREHLCQRHMQPNHWLWSFEPTNQCVTVQSLQPSNQSKDEQTQVGCCWAANIDYC